jgi:hypothetical protein
MKTTIRILLLATASALGVYADTITVVFANSDPVALAGSTISVFGTIFNNDPNLSDAPIYLNADTLTFNMPGSSVADNFFANVPLFLNPGANSGSIDLFDLTLGSQSGSFPGSYVLLGGMDGGADTAQDVLANASFTVTSTPEPAPAALAALALVFVLWPRPRTVRRAPR